MAERRGFIALGELYDYSQQVVFRHEQTLSKPKSDRMNLLKATHAHFGQIFMLYSDPAQMAEKILFSAAGSPEGEVTDEYGVSHRISRISDANTINILLSAMADKKLIIADGHHRYETALAYSKTKTPATAAPGTERNTYSLPQPPFPEAAVMMTFVNMDSEGLVILPTHRVVFGLEGFSAQSLEEKAKPYFEVERLQETEPKLLQDRLTPRRQDGNCVSGGDRGRQPASEGQTRCHRQGSERNIRSPAATRRYPASLAGSGKAAGDYAGSHPGAAQSPLHPRGRRGDGTGGKGRSECGFPDESRDHAAASRNRLCRRRDAAEIHRFLPQAAERACDLCLGLR